VLNKAGSLSPQKKGQVKHEMRFCEVFLKKNDENNSGLIKI
jgi:hypothetical protein